MLDALSEQTYKTREQAVNGLVRTVWKKIMAEDPNTLISQDGLAYRYIESQAGVHLEFFTFPGRTLCGFEFDPEGHSVPPTATNSSKQQEPFLPTDKRVITCSRCVSIVKVCKTVQIES